MTTPSAAFLDTTVFAGQQYNLASAVLESFIPVAAKSGVKILLPDPTRREISRQIKDRSNEAMKALDEARRKAPFLSKWKHFPPRNSLASTWEVGHLAKEELQKFLSKLAVLHLGYEGVSLQKIMGWYDTLRAPFGEGKKRKEFPDAFAIEIVAIYAAKHNVCVAVVSDDQDMRKACELYPSLLYFPSLPRLTELLLQNADDLTALKTSVKKGEKLLEREIEAITGSIEFYLHDDRYEREEESMCSPNLIDVRIVGVGHNECTVAFEAEFVSEHKLSWEELIDPTSGYMKKVSDWLPQTNSVEGVAKLTLDPKTRAVLSVSVVEVNETEYEVRKTPHW